MTEVKTPRLFDYVSNSQ